MRLLLAAALLAVSNGAVAHAELVASSPADGATLSAAPQAIELRFNEPVTLLAQQLLDRAGHALPLPPPRSDGRSVAIELPRHLPRGSYLFSYRVTSVDSHLVAGSIAFGVGIAPPAARLPPRDDAALLRYAVRMLRDLALLAAAGAALFCALFGRFPRDRALIVSAASAAIVAACAAWVLQGVGPDSSFARSTAVAIAGLLIVAFVPPSCRLLMAAGGLGALVSLPLTGHALIARPGGIAVGALAAHGLAAALWLGSLLALYSILAREPQRAARALRSFSPWGIAAVSTQVAGGATMAWLQLPSLGDLPASAYGRLVLGKLALFAMLLGLAALNRYRLLPALEQSSKAVPRLRRSIGAELALMVAVLAVTGVLAQTPPPSRAQTRHFSSSLLAAELSVTPARAGNNEVRVRLRDPKGAAMDVAEVAVEISNPNKGVAALSRRLRRVAPGDYRHEGAELAFPATWQIAVQARIDDFERVSFAAQVTVR